MKQQKEGASSVPQKRLAAARARPLTLARDLARDSLAGLIASALLTANITSLAALMFPGDLSVGMPMAIWAMLVGSCLAGLWIALTTSLPPLATGMDSATCVVLILLSGSVGSSVLLAGGTPQVAAGTVLLIFTATTLISGAVLLGLGACRLGSYFRFVPSFVVSGFLAATGWFLIAGGVWMTTHRTPTIGSLAADWTAAEAARLSSAVAATAVFLGLRRWSKSPLAMPAALVAMWLAGSLLLQWLGLSGPEHGWYLSSPGAPAAWSPFAIMHTAELGSPALLRLLPELLAVTIVAVISLITKTSTIELARQASADLDRELRGHGIASLIAAPFGGLMSNMQPSSSRLLERLGGTSRVSGVSCALALGAVGIADFNFATLLPIFIVAALVLYLGYSCLMDALHRLYSQRAWLDLTFAIAIMIVCIRYGYLTGVLVGIVGACLAFATSYARIGVIRSHVDRTQFASYVDRSKAASDYLRANGSAIQVYWLSGYIFFGSSEGLFERIRSDIEARPPGTVSFVILDFRMVPGADSSAIVSLSKLRDFCDRQRITIVCCSLSPGSLAVLKHEHFFDAGGRHKAFADLHVALAWCEDQLLAKATVDAGSGMAGFERWLEQQLGSAAVVAELLGYLERKDVPTSQVLYRQGEPAGTIDLVAAGNLSIDVALGNGQTLRVRRIMKHTVVGEMGFVRRSARSATVSTEGPATLFTLTRENFERMRRERHDLASIFDDFIMRVLADRIEFANREIAALSDGQRR
jgi:SulP family sulfate permease